MKGSGWLDILIGVEATGSNHKHPPHTHTHTAGGHSALDEQCKYIGVMTIQHLFHRRSEIKALHWIDKKQMINNDCFLFTLSNLIYFFILHMDSSNYQLVVPGLVQIGSQIDFSILPMPNMGWYVFDLYQRSVKSV